MKKIQVLIISLLFLITNNLQASFLQGPNPYSFGPQGRSVSDLRDFAKPKQMVRILPNMPVVATDSSGNRVYYTPDGKMTLSVARDGSMSFSLGGVTKNFNSDGEYSGETRTIRGSGLLQETKDKDGNVLAYSALNGKGKVARTYDKDMNLTATYNYTGQGAKVKTIKNEMTGGTTCYDEYNRKTCERDFDGYILRTYQYEDVSYVMAGDVNASKSGNSEESRKELVAVKNDKKTRGSEPLLVTTRDYGYKAEEINEEEGLVRYNYVYTTTYYDQEGNVTVVKNPNGQETMEYTYKKDEQGNTIKDYVIDKTTRQKTYFDEHGNRDRTVLLSPIPGDSTETLIAKHYDGYSINYEQGAVTSVTRYDIDGKELYTTFKNVIYNDDGTINEVKEGDDNDGSVIDKYHYTKDSEGNKIIDYVENNMNFEFGTKTYTWYSDDGKPMWVTSTKERPKDVTDTNILKVYSWSADGNTLVYTFNTQTQYTQYYDMKKEQVYEALNERIISKNIYDKGQLIGRWDAQKKELTIYTNERAWISVALDKEPASDSIRSIMANAKAINDEINENKNSAEKGVIKKNEQESVPVLTGLLKAYGLLD